MRTGRCDLHGGVLPFGGDPDAAGMQHRLQKHYGRDGPDLHEGGSAPEYQNAPFHNMPQRATACYGMAQRVTVCYNIPQRVT
eukprot:519595-Pyramimonas_sp.AAC.2